VHGDANCLRMQASHFDLVFAAVDLEMTLTPFEKKPRRQLPPNYRSRHMNDKLSK